MDKIKGKDSTIESVNSSARRASNTGGTKVKIAVGINLLNINKTLNNQRLALEFTAPIYQDLNGPQMKEENILTFGWQYSY